MAAQIKKYDPNQYNFENFAKTMNQNFAIERAQNGQGGAFGVNAGVNAANPVNLGGTTNSQTLGNLNVTGNNLGETLAPLAIKKTRAVGDVGIYGAITKGFSDVLNGVNKGEAIQYNTPTYETVREGAFSAVSGNQWGAGEADVYPTSSTLGENDDAITKAIGEYGRSLGGDSFKITDENINDVREHLASQGYSPQDINNVLNREGGSLSWSYAPTQQDVINDPITQEITNEVNDTLKSGKLDYETWRSTYSVDPAVEYQNAQAQLDYEFQTWMSTYGARAEQLYQMGLSNSGVSDVYGANAYSVYVQASMDLKRAQIAQEKENKALYAQYSAEYDAQQSSMTSAAFNAYASTYTPDQEQSVRVALKAQGLSAEQVESAIAQLNNYYNSLPEDQRPDVVAGNAKVNEAFQSLAASYATDNSTDKDQRIRNMYAAMGWSQSEIDKLIDMLNGFAGVSGSAVNPAIQEAYLSYVGSYEKSMANTITTDLENLGWSNEDISTLIGMLDRAVDAQGQSVVDETVGTLEATADVTPETIVMSTLVNDLKGYKTQLAAGKITQAQYDQYASSFSNSAVKAYEWAVKSVDNMADAYAMFGFDEAEWSEMDDAQRESAIMDEMAEYRTEGLLSAERYNSVVKSWADSEIKVAIDTDKENGQATGLREFGAVAATLLEWKNSGALSEKEYLEQLQNVISNSGLYLDNGIKWSTVPTADTHIRTKNMNGSGYVADKDLISILDNNVSNVAGSYVAYNDTLYVYRFDRYAGKYMWQPLDIDHYDLPWTGAAFNKTQREGVHELLKILYGVKPPKDTRR